ncbi:MAG TPA: GNAT family N-acetyltransferase [Kribbellaceae bacterium]|nr:GNAT family N-acetyltransferase [Kribbellaceae bacterium]
MITDRLELRRFDAGDVDNLVALDGDTEVMRYLDGGTQTRAEVESSVLPGLLAYHDRYDDYGYWAAHTRSDRAFVGWFALYPVRPTDDAMVFWPETDDAAVLSLGYRLRRTAWGHGYATEGARALVHRAFEELGADEVVATTMAVNTGSRRVLEKAGLRYVRTVHLRWDEPLAGNEYGDVEYRLSRDAYRKG